MTVANRSPAPTVQNLPDNRSSMSLISRSATPPLFGGFGLGKRLSGLLREAMELRQSYRRGEASDYVAETERLRREVSYHLRDRPMPALDSDRGPDRDNGRLQNELGWHDDRGNLLRFLDDPGIEPTNNRAERALRGTVIASQGHGSYRLTTVPRLTRFVTLRQPSS